MLSNFAANGFPFIVGAQSFTHSPNFAMTTEQNVCANFLLLFFFSIAIWFVLHFKHHIIYLIAVCVCVCGADPLGHRLLMCYSCAHRAHSNNQLVQVN